MAVGEIGLDFFVPGLDAERQIWFYEQQIQLARAFGLPVILHVRKSSDRLLKTLRATLDHTKAELARQLELDALRSEHRARASRYRMPMMGQPAFNAMAAVFRRQPAAPGPGRRGRSCRCASAARGLARDRKSVV